MQIDEVERWDLSGGKDRMNRTARLFLGAACVGILMTRLVTAGEPNRPPTRVLTLHATRMAELRIELPWDFKRSLIPFEKEPAPEGKQIARNWIPTEPPTPLLRNITDGQLLVNADHAPDFTSSPVDTYASRCPDGVHVYFEGMHVSSRQGSVEIPYTIGLRTYQKGLGGWFFVLSGWSARFDDGDSEWIFTVTDNLDGQIDARDRLILERVRPSEGPRVRHECPAPSVLFLDGRAFRLDFTYKQAGTEVVLEAAMTDLDLPMGRLRIDANDCESVVLRAESLIVPLSNPGGVVSAPVGDYRVETCVIRSQEIMPAFAGCDRILSVRTDETAQLRLGTPLSNTLIVTRDRNVLGFKYQLAGAGGELYDYDNAGTPPGFRIYKGFTKIGEGCFGFG
jgi:hypothetical protein